MSHVTFIASFKYIPCCQCIDLGIVVSLSLGAASIGVLYPAVARIWSRAAVNCTVGIAIAAESSPRLRTRTAAIDTKQSNVSSMVSRLNSYFRSSYR